MGQHIQGISRRQVLSASVAAAAALGAPGLRASSFASKPIKFIVPFAAGGATDVMARALGEAIGKELGQPVVVDNKAGAAGLLACDALSKAAADGHTWLLGTTSTMITNRFLYKKLPHEVNDIGFVARVVNSPIVLAVHPSVPAKTVAEVVAYFKANKGKVSYGSYGLGSHAHLILSQISLSTGADATHIAYKGESPMVMELMAGQVSVGMGSPLGLKQHAEAGKLRLIGVLGQQRSSLLPDLPTFWEQNFREPAYQTIGTTAFAAHSKTPMAIQEQFAQALSRALQQPDVRARIEATGYPLVDKDTPAAFTAQVNKDMPIWKTMIEQAGIQPT